MEYMLRASDTFSHWLQNLKDKSSKIKILARLGRIENGNFGDYKHLISNLFELRFFFGSGYRVYFTIRQKDVVFLSIGSDISTQSRDVEKALALLTQLDNRNEI